MNKKMEELFYSNISIGLCTAILGPGFELFVCPCIGIMVIFISCLLFKLAFCRISQNLPLLTATCPIYFPVYSVPSDKDKNVRR